MDPREGEAQLQKGPGLPAVCLMDLGRPRPAQPPNSIIPALFYQSGF